MLMKFAYRRLIKVKSNLSIANILDKYKDAQLILSSPDYLAIESLVSSEELPIAMFLTSMKEEITKYVSTEGEIHEIIKEELANLFKICCSFTKIEWVFGMHIRLLAQARNSGAPTDILTFCLGLKESLNMDESISDPAVPNSNFESTVSKKFTGLSERELLGLLEAA
jgi:hypothetical protein